MRKQTKFLPVMLIILVLPIIFSLSKSLSQEYEVKLSILNDVGPNGAISVIAGKDIEILFNISDPHKKLSANDRVRLVRVGSGQELQSKERGNSLKGSIVFDTGSRVGTGGEVIVEYIHNNKVVATAPSDIRLYIKENISKLELLYRLIVLEQIVSALLPKVEEGITGSRPEHLNLSMPDCYSRAEIKALFAEIQAQIDILHTKNLKSRDGAAGFFSSPAGKLPRSGEADSFSLTTPPLHSGSRKR